MRHLLLNLDQVRKIIGGRSKSFIYDAIKKGRFPKPVKIGKRAVAWRMEDIEKWADNLSNERQKGEGI